MFKKVLVKLSLIIYSIIIISCGEINNQNPMVNQDVNENTLYSKMIGLWKYTDHSGKKDNTIDIYFKTNNLCNIFLESTGRELENSFCTYKTYTNNRITTVLISDKQNKQTVFRLNKMDDEKMKVVFEVINDVKQKSNKEVSLVKYIP